MATFAALAEQIWQQLENRPLYPLAEVLANGVNPAMQILCLLDPTLCIVRTAVTLPARSLLLDLRSVAPRTHQVLRVILGDVTTGTPVRTASHFVPLLPTTRERLAMLYADWLRQTGVPTRWFLLGRHFLACWPRPVMDVTLTLVSAAVPTAATVATQANTPDLDAAQHPLIADLATALLLCKQGAGEGDRAIQQLSTLLGAEAFSMLRKRQRERLASTPQPQEASA